MAITLIPETLAKEGYRFHYRGANAGEECQGCPYTGLCFGLKPGHTYTVSNLRNVVHPCGLHEEGKVRVVEVEEAAIHTSVESRLLKGTAVTWKPINCERPDCKNYGFCHPVGPAADVSYKILEAGETMDCPADYKIQRVSLQQLEQ